MKDKTSMRLIWKEYREGWPVILAFFVLPGIVFPICGRFPDSALASAMTAAVMFAVPFTAVLWASEKQKLVKHGRDILEAVLPVTPAQEWAFSFILPAIVVGICGAWMHLLHNSIPMGITGSYSPSVEPAYVIFAGMVVTASAYMLSSFLSKTVSHLLGIMAGTIWILATTPPIDFIVNVSVETAIVPIALILAALAVAEFKKLGSRQSKAFGWIMLVAITGITTHKGTVETYQSAQNDFFTNNRSGEISQLYLPDGSSVYNGLIYTNIITFDDAVALNTSPQAIGTKIKTNMQFPPVSTPVAYDRNRRVYVFTQKPGYDEIGVSRWDTRSGQIDQICKLSGNRLIRVDKLLVVDNNHLWLSQPGLADSAGKKLLLNTLSKMGNGCDLWLINLRTGKYKLLLVNYSYSWSKYTWTKDRVYLTGSSKSLEVNTLNGTVKPLVHERSSK